MTVLPGTPRASRISHQVLLGRGVDAGDRLVEQVQVGPRRERPGEEDAPALAARQRADLAVAVVPPCRPVSSAAATALAVVAARERRSPISGYRPIIATSPTVTGNAQSTELGLGHVGDRLAARPGGAAETPRPCRERPQQPGDDLEQRALAGAVRTDDGEQRAGRDLQVDVGQGDPVAVAGRDVGGGVTAAVAAVPSSERLGDDLVARCHAMHLRGMSSYGRRPDSVVVERRHDGRDAGLLGERLGELGVELRLAKTALTPAALTLSTRPAQLRRRSAPGPRSARMTPTSSNP